MHALHCRPTLFASAMLVVLSSNGLGSGPPVDLDQRRSLEQAPWQSIRSAVLDGRDVIWIGPRPGGPEFYMPPDSGPDYSSWPYRGGAWGRGSFSFPSTLKRIDLASLEHIFEPKGNDTDSIDIEIPPLLTAESAARWAAEIRSQARRRALEIQRHGDLGPVELPTPKYIIEEQQDQTDQQRFEPHQPYSPPAPTMYDDFPMQQSADASLREAVSRIHRLIEHEERIRATTRQLETGGGRRVDPFRAAKAMEQIEKSLDEGEQTRKDLVATQNELDARLRYLDAVGELLFGDAQDLFNRVDLSGWQLAGDAHKSWTTRDRRIVNTGEAPSNLQTTREFASFLLCVEWRWSENPGSAGILLRAVTQDDAELSGLQVQLGHGRAGELVMIGRTDAQADARRRPGRRIRRMLAAESPVGEWNSCVVALIDDQITVWTNGQLVNEASGVTLRKRRICLQAMGAPIEFRNIRITPLD